MTREKKILKFYFLKIGEINWTLAESLTLVDRINDQLSQLNTAVADRRKYATVMKKIDWNFDGYSAADCKTHWEVVKVSFKIKNVVFYC